MLITKDVLIDEYVTKSEHARFHMLERHAKERGDDLSTKQL